MKTIAFLGPQNSGKTTITRILNQQEGSPQKTVVPEYSGDILDTPGEYIEHRLYFSRFQVLVAEYKIIGIVIPCKFDNIYIPPNFMSMFSSHKHIGIITKTDLGNDEDIIRCKDFLKNVGIIECYPISIYDQESILRLQEAIQRYK